MSRPIRWEEWKPPHDPYKPDFPYRSAAQLSIQRHLPPLPFGPGYRRPPRHIFISRDELYHTLPSQFCLENPPPSTRPHPDSSVHTLRIVEEIAAGDGRGSQVVSCLLDPDEGGGEQNRLVAKIFDPLYYHWYPQDTSWMADYHYSREAAAYRRAERAGIDGISIPKYYGSWTFQLPMDTPSGPPQDRHIRMILIGYLPHPTMFSLMVQGKDKDLSLDTKFDLLGKAMELCCGLHYYGIIHNDMAPRNIIIGKDLRVTLIDLGQAIVSGLPSSLFPFKQQDLPRSPIDIGVQNELLTWLPAECQSPEVFDEWMWERWGKSTRFRPPERARLSLLREGGG